MRAIHAIDKITSSNKNWYTLIGSIDLRENNGNHALGHVCSKSEGTYYQAYVL